MKLLIIRHGDPNYEIDSLTEKGKLEAELLCKRLNSVKIDDAYVSPLGRARLTADIALSDKDIVPEVCDWLHEFGCSAQNPQKSGVIWDLRPSYFAEHKTELLSDNWQLFEMFEGSDVKDAYQKVADGVDDILSKHGYKRNGLLYDAINPCYDTIALFCHYGVESMILSHILNVSPYVFLQGFCALTSSVTTVVTEEREKGIASFRCLSFGDLSHLYAANCEPSFAGRFAEIYGNGDRQD